MKTIHRKVNEECIIFRWNEKLPPKSTLAEKKNITKILQKYAKYFFKTNNKNKKGLFLCLWLKDKVLTEIFTVRSYQSAEARAFLSCNLHFGMLCNIRLNCK